MLIGNRLLWMYGLDGTRRLRGNSTHASYPRDGIPHCSNSRVAACNFYIFLQTGRFPPSKGSRFCRLYVSITRLSG